MIERRRLIAGAVVHRPVSRHAQRVEHLQHLVGMQSSNRPGLEKRALFYWARLYSGSLERGQEYTELLPTVSFFILDYAPAAQRPLPQ